MSTGVSQDNNQQIMQLLMQQNPILNIDPHWDVHTMSFYFIVMMLTNKIESMSNQMGGLGTQANAFGQMRQDIINIENDIKEQQAYMQQNGNPTTLPPAMVNKFSQDVLKATQDAVNLQLNYPGVAGSGDPLSALYHILSTPIGPSGSGYTLGSAILNHLLGQQDPNSPNYNAAEDADFCGPPDGNNDPGLSVWAQQSSTDTSGTYYNMLNNGIQGGMSLTDLDTELGTTTSDLDTLLNTDATYLSQCVTVGQNGTKAYTDFESLIVNNQKSS